MLVDNAITRFIDTNLIEEDKLERDNHVSSGKLSANYLYKPKRFQLLKYLGVAGKPADCFSLRKFARGRAVEDYYVEKLEKMGIVVETQKEVSYRDTVGKVDVVVDSKTLDFKLGIIPHEVKSVTNRNFKWIKDNGEISEHYHLQACLYALAMESEYYALDFIASDDLREYVTIHETKHYKKEVDRIITEYNEMIRAFQEHATIPEWKVNYKWQENPMYMPFDEFWAKCTAKEFIDKLKELGAFVVKD
ncbi:MAG: hypothetical protein ACOX6V_05045 [Patescibacteria group bacterium]|jgi:hypothetical protein